MIYFRTTPKKMWWSLLRILHIKSFTVGAESVAAEFPDAPPDVWTKSNEIIDFPEALRLCARAFEQARRRCWILLDRLDAVFQESPDRESLALRALLVAYKDFMGYPFIRIKLFMRSDLYDQVVSTGGFRELTHIQDRTSPAISWDSDKLLHMLMERFAFNDLIRSKVGFSREDIQNAEMRSFVFFTVFPSQIDVGPRKPDTWAWMLSRIRDGNSVRTPRDLHTLVQNAARKQQELLTLGGDDFASELISAQAVKAGLSQLSEDKVRTSLIAENITLRGTILAFTKQKAEQDENTLHALLGTEWKSLTERLVRIGFLEKAGATWKVPLLYRDGLQIVQGAAFDK